MKKFLLSILSLLMLTALPASAETFKEFMEALSLGQSKTFVGSLVCSFRANENALFYMQDVEGTYGIMVQGKEDNANILTGTVITNPTITRGNYSNDQKRSVSGYTVSGTQTVNPIVTTLDKINDYKYMLVKVNDVTFTNAGNLFSENSQGRGIDEPIKQGNVSANVNYLAGLTGTVIPERADVTGISLGEMKIGPRSLADLKVLSGGVQKDMDLARFVSLLAIGAENAMVFEGELDVTWVENASGAGYVIYQDDSYGAMCTIGDKGLKTGDKIKNVKIMRALDQAPRDHNYQILSYELVSRNNTVTPLDITIAQLENSSYPYMMVRVSDVEIEHPGAPVFAADGKYNLRKDGVTYTNARVAAKCCSELVGEAIPDKVASITGIAFYGTMICPVTPAGLQGVGGEVAAIKEYPSIAAYKTGAGQHPLAKITGNTQVIYSEFKDNYTGTFILQDATGGLLVEGQGIGVEGIAQGTELKDVVLNRTEQGKFMLSRYDGQVATVVSKDNNFAPRVIQIGGFSADTRSALDYTLVQYQDVKFNIVMDTFSKALVSEVENADGQKAVVYPYDAVMGQMIPTVAVDVTGVAYYNSELDQYQVRPRTMDDISAADTEGAPVIMLDPLTMRLRALPGETAKGDLKVDAMRATAPVSITRKGTDGTQVINPSATEIAVASLPATVTFTFAPTENKLYVETFLFNTEGLAAPMEFAVTGDATTGVSMIAADAAGRYRAYDLQGRRVLDTDNAADLRTLPTGLYIVNGTKLLVR